MIEWKSLKFQYEKQMAVQKMAVNQQIDLEREMESLKDEIAKSTTEILYLKEKLEQSREKVLMQSEYDKLAKEILKIPSRAKSQKAIDLIERDIRQSQIELELIDEIVGTRKKQFQSFVANIYDLKSKLEFSKAYESVELAKRLASIDHDTGEKLEEEEDEDIEMNEHE